MNYCQKYGGHQLEFIPDYHRVYDPLHYPLIFLDGQYEWHCDLSHVCLQYVNYQLTERVKDGELIYGDMITNPILQEKSLGRHYTVGQVAKIELSRLNYIYYPQK